VRRSVLRLYRIISLKITTHVYELGIRKQLASATRKMLKRFLLVIRYINRENKTEYTELFPENPRKRTSFS
jgi:hypothetical protein